MACGQAVGLVPGRWQWIWGRGQLPGGQHCIWVPGIGEQAHGCQVQDGVQVPTFTLCGLHCSAVSCHLFQQKPQELLLQGHKLVLEHLLLSDILP